MNISHYLFLLFWMMKPFYFGPSGTMQISDFVFMLSFLAWVILQNGNILLDKRDLILFWFVFATLIINSIYTIIHKDPGFLLSTAYYVFSFLVVIVIRDLIKSKPFLKALLWTSAFNLLVQLSVLFIGTGRYLWGIYRFMGTFNDPNQFAFSMFTSFLLVYILSSYFKELGKTRKKHLVVMMFGLAVYFVVQGSSTGMLLGFGTFTILFIISFINSEKSPAFMLLKVISTILLASIVIFVLLKGFAPANIDGSVSSGSFLVSRLFEKVNKVEGGGFMALLEDRAIDKIFTNPMYLFFGSGEGGMWRFPGPGYEIHSTLPAIIFYYGILPFILLSKWLRLNLKNTSRILIPAYLALLVESFTLAHQRQPALWMIIVLGSLEYANTREFRKYRIVTRL